MLSVFMLNVVAPPTDWEIMPHEEFHNTKRIRKLIRTNVFTSIQLEIIVGSNNKDTAKSNDSCKQK
jgi:hypothetical protein